MEGGEVDSPVRVAIHVFLIEVRIVVVRIRLIREMGAGKIEDEIPKQPLFVQADKLFVFGNH